MMKFSKRDSKKMIKEMARLYGLSVSEVREQIQDKIIAVMEVTTQTSRQSLSKSEFIEKATLFYAGYLSAEDNKTYLPNIVTSTLKSIVAESDHRQNRMIFKLAVEMAVMMNVIAANNSINPVSLERLRGECVKEVKRLNGSFSFDDAVSWQKGWEENE